MVFVELRKRFVGRRGHRDDRVSTAAAAAASRATKEKSKAQKPSSNCDSGGIDGVAVAPPSTVDATKTRQQPSMLPELEAQNRQEGKHQQQLQNNAPVEFRRDPSNPPHDLQQYETDKVQSYVSKYYSVENNKCDSDGNIDTLDKLSKRIKLRVTGASNLVEFSRKRRAILMGRKSSDSDNSSVSIECIPNASDLILGDCLGQGSFSSVFALKGVRKSSNLVDRTNNTRSSSCNKNGFAGRNKRLLGSSTSCGYNNSIDEIGRAHV